ncbi:MAG TPA: DUF445 domain-containing protein [Acidimicrobiales bacterium]|nr:DUF445 domain-containing protein [Acidimicrobiales bacterium]
MTSEEELRARQLAVMKRRATGLLVVVTGLFGAIVVLGDDRSGWGYLQAAAEGSMVGGLADWFAVTALFRHPLGLPIPHTAIIREHKDQFGATLGSFVQDNFLSADNIAERVHTSRVVERAAAWMTLRTNAETVARYVTDAIVGFADVVRDEDVHRLVNDEVDRLVDRLPVADLAARGIEIATADGRHQQLLDAILRSVSGYLDDNRDDLRARFANESPWWLPGAAQDRIFERILDGARAWLAAIVGDPEHEMRKTFDERIISFVARLRDDPELIERADDLKHDLVAHPELRQWVGGLWGDVKAGLREQAADPSSRLRSRVADAVMAAGERLSTDEALQDKARSFLERAVRYVAEHYGDEIGDLITGTIERWDAEETSRKLELLLGRDLQFIRINGTVVGGLAGLAIHAIADVAG